MQSSGAVGLKLHRPHRPHDRREPSLASPRTENSLAFEEKRPPSPTCSQALICCSLYRFHALHSQQGVLLIMKHVLFAFPTVHQLEAQGTGVPVVLCNFSVLTYALEREFHVPTVLMLMLANNRSLYNHNVTSITIASGTCYCVGIVLMARTVT